VFTEIGMDGLTYFLAMCKLARRTGETKYIRMDAACYSRSCVDTVAFWGHAVTSGISVRDIIHIQNVADDLAGGVDYFVSSKLFEPRLRVRGHVATLL
jgi:hypothetical protein